MYYSKKQFLLCKQNSSFYQIAHLLNHNPPTSAAQLFFSLVGRSKNIPVVTELLDFYLSMASSLDLGKEAAEGKEK